MFYSWKDSICDSFISSFGRQPSIEDLPLLNRGLLHLLQSPLWQGSFDGSSIVSEQGRCYVLVPERGDPDCSQTTLWEEQRVSVIDQDYFDERELRYYSEVDFNRLINQMMRHPDISLLSERREKNLTSLMKNIDKVRYSFHDVECWDDINEFGSDGFSIAVNAFGHRYLSNSENRKYIVASNILGPVGILCLFDHGMEGVLDHRKYLYSISFVSVTPEYRRKGIASELMRKALEYARENNLILGRTRPSKIGVNTFDHFSELASREFSDIPFIKAEEMPVLYELDRHLDLEKISSNARNRLINKSLYEFRASQDLTRVSHNIRRHALQSLRSISYDM